MAASWGTLDGTNSAQMSGGSSMTLTITTTTANDLIVVLVGSETYDDGYTALVESMTDGGSAGITFTKRKQLNLAVSGTTYAQNCEIWWGIAPTVLNNEPINITWTNEVDCAVAIVIAIPGANTTNPWDTNSSLTADTECLTYADTTTVMECTVSTTAPSTMVLALVGGPGTGFVPMPYPQNPVPSTITTANEYQNGNGNLAETLVVGVNWYTSPQTNIPFGWNWTNENALDDYSEIYQSSFIVLVDAIVQAGSGGFTPKSRRTFGPRIGDRQAIGW